MGSFVACYLIVWATLALYVARLGVNQCRLRRDLDRLQQQFDRRQEASREAARAA